MPFDTARHAFVSIGRDGSTLGFGQARLAVPSAWRTSYQSAKTIARRAGSESYQILDVLLDQAGLSGSDDLVDQSAKESYSLENVLIRLGRREGIFRG